jgi:hypothetical protein
MNNSWVSEGVLFPQATGCYDKILQFHNIKHHFKPIWITVWLPLKKKGFHCSPPQPLQSQTIQTEWHFILPAYHIWPYFLTKLTLLQVTEVAVRFLGEFCPAFMGCKVVRYRTMQINACIICPGTSYRLSVSTCTCSRGQNHVYTAR